MLFTALGTSTPTVFCCSDSCPVLPVVLFCCVWVIAPAADKESSSIAIFLIINVACKVFSEYGTNAKSSILNPKVESFSIAYTNSDIEMYSPLAVNDILYRPATVPEDTFACIVTLLFVAYRPILVHK